MHMTDLTRTELEAVASGLRARGLAVPAWVLLESLRPLNWLLGQAMLVAQPLVRAVGLGSGVDRLAALLTDPAALAYVSWLLAPDETE